MNSGHSQKRPLVSIISYQKLRGRDQFNSTLHSLSRVVEEGKGKLLAKRESSCLDIFHTHLVSTQ